MPVRELPLSQAREGLILGRTVTAPDGTLLAEKGAVLTGHLLLRLAQWRIGSVPVWEDEAVSTPLELYERAKLTAEKVVKLNEGLKRGGELQEQMTSVTRRMLDTLQMKREMDYPAAKGVVEKLLGEVIGQPEVMSTLLTVRHFDTYLMNHSLNVSVLAVMTGHIMGLAQEELRVIGEAALLHDVGMTIIPSVIWNKNAPLTDNERFEVQKHPIFSADIVDKIYGIDVALSRVVYQHHERADGSGYPKGLSGGRLTRNARILAVADTYDAMSNPRPYRQAIIPHESIRALITLANTALDQETVRAFITHMSFYPVGSVIRLSSGELAVVVLANRTTPLRPQVKICQNVDGRYTADGPYLNLAVDEGLNIAECVSDPAVIADVLDTLAKPVSPA